MMGHELRSDTDGATLKPKRDLVGEAPRTAYSPSRRSWFG